MSAPPKPWETGNDQIAATGTVLDAAGNGHNTGFSAIGGGYGGYSGNSFGGGYGGYNSMLGNTFGNYGGYNSMMNPQMQMNNPVVAKLQTFQQIISTFYSTAHVLESSYQFIMNIVYIFIGMHEQIDGAKSRMWKFYDSTRSVISQLKNTSIKDLILKFYNKKPSLNADEFKNYLKNKEKHWSTLKLVLSIIGTLYFIRRVAAYLMHVPIAKIVNISPEMQNLGLKIGDGIGILSYKLLDVDASKPQSLARWQGKSIKIPTDSYEIIE
eukprot:NODE_275_length_12088_cov_0.250813.p6 type:complete len:268 gc:universal NODE_275_length_12088_cov_0.250813:2202-3005(+)